MKKAVSMFLVIVFLVSLSGCAGDTNSGLDDNTRKKVTQVINGYCSSLKNHDIESFGKYVSKDIKDLYKQYRKEALDPITECKVLLIELDNAKFDKNNPPKKIEVLVRYELEATTECLGTREIDGTPFVEIFTLKRSKGRYIITDTCSAYTMVPPWSFDYDATYETTQS
jgi:hypothetical protein